MDSSHCQVWNPPSLPYVYYFDYFDSRHAGRRIGDYLDRIIPIVVEFSKLENDDELRECCIQVFNFDSGDDL